jgi:hypothetical protein
MPFGIEELIIGAAVGATVASPKGRHWMRRGLVYGLAGAITVYDRAASLAKGAAQGVRDGVNSLREEAAKNNSATHAETAPEAAAPHEPTHAGTPPS